jgi:ubiquinone/menaquinone biosynthesis C-methylase UbiE
VSTGENGGRGDLGHAELQLDWDAGNLESRWPSGLDTAYLLIRVAALPSDVTAEGGPGRVLEVAAAEAVHSCKLSLLGMDSVVVEPSPTMLERARRRIAEQGARVALVRGVAETLPFADGTFDRVLIDSAIDHLGKPELSLREMTRVLKPDGRLVISFVNYGGVSVRVSRMLYAAARRLGLASRRSHLPWDSPVPIEHTFECTYPVLRRLCDPLLQLDRVFGVSIGWLVPGWGAVLQRLPQPRALDLVRRLDRFAFRRPGLADFVVSVWRPRPGPAAAQAVTVARNDYAVQPDEVVYPGKIRAEAEYWERVRDPRPLPLALTRCGGRHANAAYTGDPQRGWIDDLLRRGPFRRAAVLGCDDDGALVRWRDARASERTDVYELSPAIIRQTRVRLGLAGLGRRHAGMAFIRADLNVVAFPADTYDVVWSSDCLHHIVNLEHLLAEVARALRDGGLFAFREYVGERRMQFSAERLARANMLLAEVPARWRRSDALQAPRIETLSPFCAVRSDEIVALAEGRFEPLYKRQTGALQPLWSAVDVDALERDAPDLAARLASAEAEATLPPCEVYAVFRKR